MTQKSLPVFLYFLILAPAAFCQDEFDGTIEYHIKTESNHELSERGSMKFFIGGDNLLIRITVLNQENSNTELLFRKKDNAAYLISDSSKAAYKLNLADFKNTTPAGKVPEEYEETYTGALREAKISADSLKLRLMDTGETSRIAGFDCRKFRVEGEKNISESYVWLAPEIQVSVPTSIGDETGPLSGLFTDKGFPLRIENISLDHGIKQVMTVEAVRVDRKAVDPGFFEIPEGYQTEDLMQLFGK